MATIHSRLARLENQPATDGLMAKRAEIEAVKDAMADETFVSLVDDLRDAVCRADTDPSLKHQQGPAIPGGPSVEEFERRLGARLAELRNL